MLLTQNFLKSFEFLAMKCRINMWICLSLLYAIDKQEIFVIRVAALLKNNN